MNHILFLKNSMNQLSENDIISKFKFKHLIIIKKKNNKKLLQGKFITKFFFH